jgi:hypothetical protein
VYRFVWLRLLAGFRTLARYIRRWIGQRRLFKADYEAGGRIQIIDNTIAELEDLNRVTEREFLDVGVKLLDFRSTARQIACELTNLSENVSGEKDNRTSGALTLVLERSQESYTMQAQRDVHQAIDIHVASVFDKKEVPAMVISGEADFGQNVEFF